MFYSHQLLARKAPLGQIWIAATLDNKIKRRNLEKLDIPRICEEILNPSIPMALRLSGILMGGVVNVYKRKVDVLYYDVNRFLEELNRAYKAKAAGSKTQAKGKAQAKSEAAITIEDKDNANVDTEQDSMRYFDPLLDTARLRNLTLEDLNDQYINIYIGDDDPFVQRNQANPDDITLPDKVDLGTIHTGPYGRFERIDIADDIFSHVDFTSQAFSDIAPQVPSQAPTQQESLQGDARERRPMEAENQPLEEGGNDVQKNGLDKPEVQRPLKRKDRGNSSRVIIDEQMMIPSETYHSWLNDASDISSMRRRRKTKPTHILRTTKIGTLINMPPLCLMNSSTNFLGENHYPETLMKLWKKDIIGNPQTPPATSKNGMSHSLPDEMEPQNFAEFGDFDIEKMMAAEEGLYMASNGIPGIPGGSTSSGSHGETSQLVASSETDHNPHTSGRFTRRQNSLSIGNLDTVAEDIIMADLAPLKETGPTQTPLHGAPEHSINKVTESIRLQLKSHFDTPGNSQTESLNQLAEGLPRKRAALLFYQTCVMATMDFVKVEQTVPFGDIVISRGPKM